MRPLRRNLLFRKHLLHNHHRRNRNTPRLRSTRQRHRDIRLKRLRRRSLTIRIRRHRRPVRRRG